MLSYLLSAAALLTLVASQAEVPQDLSGSFDPDSIDLQVSFGGDASEGLTSGASVSRGEVENTPAFALGDSSGVSTVVTYVIMMIDTTDENARVLHYLHSGFKSSGTKTKIESDIDPEVPYQAPGAEGGSGSRQYSFLLYRQNGGQQQQLSGAPAAGDVIDVKNFENDNDLQEASAGVALSVDLDDDSPAPSSTDSTESSTATGAAPSPSSTDADAAESEPEAEESSASGLNPVAAKGAITAASMVVVFTVWELLM